MSLMDGLMATEKNDFTIQAESSSLIIITILIILIRFS